MSQENGFSDLLLISPQKRGVYFGLRMEGGTMDYRESLYNLINKSTN
ncbi:hypothetical protein D1AOALGA4SA_565 [Olavius algarvensis Delta 1 endosymbiont]|nr:hypothetical protein D1AOALGA4SA_565 [Olavius algarvensis Delta 1 endosymbiont]